MPPAYRQAHPAGSRNCPEFVQTKPIGRCHALSPPKLASFRTRAPGKALPGLAPTFSVASSGRIGFVSQDPFHPALLRIWLSCVNPGSVASVCKEKMWFSRETTKPRSRGGVCFPVPLCVFVFLCEPIPGSRPKAAPGLGFSAAKSYLHNRRFPSPVCYAQTKIAKIIFSSMPVRASLRRHDPVVGSPPIRSGSMMPAGLMACKSWTVRHVPRRVFRFWGFQQECSLATGTFPQVGAGPRRVFAGDDKAGIHSTVCEPRCSAFLLEARNALNATLGVQADIRGAGKPTRGRRCVAQGRFRPRGSRFFCFEPTARRVCRAHHLPIFARTTPRCPPT
jgi:hypothetical protein